MAEQICRKGHPSRWVSISHFKSITLSLIVQTYLITWGTTKYTLREVISSLHYLTFFAITIPEQKKTTGQTYPSKLVHIPQNVCWHFEEGFSTKPPSLICMHQPQHSIWPWCRCVRYYLHHQCGLHYKWLQQNQWIAWGDYTCRCLYQSGQISRVEHVGTNTHHQLSTWPLLHQNISLHDIFLKLSYPALWKS